MAKLAVLETGQTRFWEQGLPDQASLAALRAVCDGLDARAAVERYVPQFLEDGSTARAVIGRIRRQLQAEALRHRRPDLAEAFASARAGRGKSTAKAVTAAVDELRSSSLAAPLLGDDVADWLSPRVAATLHAAGLKTLAALVLAVPRRREWWTNIPGLGRTGAQGVEEFFAAHSDLTAAARSVVVKRHPETEIRPWELLRVPDELDGSKGRFRAPAATCTLSAKNDYQAVHAWLNLHEAEATRRAYRKEAERLILWAVLERGKALSSLAAEDATLYRAFLRRPTPQSKWVGPSRPREDPEWRPFAGPLAANSVKYALSVLAAMFRWLNDQRYLAANPFSGLKVRGAESSAPFDRARYFSQGEWTLLRVVADGLEHSYGWSEDAAVRLRFVLDFERGTGLRASELTSLRLSQVSIEELDAWWLNLVGKGAKKGRVALPPLARQALTRYLVYRGLPTTPRLWSLDTPILAAIGHEEGRAGISTTRLRNFLDRFFDTVAGLVEADNPAMAAKLRRATTHWMRHTHATHALEGGVPLTSVRDNLRHASVSTTSNYLHTDEMQRGQTLARAFGDS